MNSKLLKVITGDDDNINASIEDIYMSNDDEKHENCTFGCSGVKTEGDCAEYKVRA